MADMAELKTLLLYTFVNLVKNCCNILNQSDYGFQLYLPSKRIEPFASKLIHKVVFF